MSEDAETTPSLSGPLVAIAICAPTILGAYPVSLALMGMRFGPPAWVAISWQLASTVSWAILATFLLQILRRRTDTNVALGRATLSIRSDGAALWPALLGALVAHAVTIATTSVILLLGRGRPAYPRLVLDILFLYAPMNVMTLLGLIGAAVVAAEHRARLVESNRRVDLERQLDDSRSQVFAAMAALNGAVPEQAFAPPAEPLDRLTVTTGNRTAIVAADEIDWIEARSYYARLHVGDRTHLVRQSMNDLEQRLDPKRFARIHRSTIVNLDRVTELRPYDRRSFVVILRDGQRLMMSRRRRRLLDYLLP